MIASASQICVQGNENTIYNIFLIIIVSHLVTAADFNHEWAHWETGLDVSTDENERYTYGLINFI